LRQKRRASAQLNNQIQEEGEEIVEASTATEKAKESGDPTSDPTSGSIQTQGPIQTLGRNRRGVLASRMADIPENKEADMNDIAAQEMEYQDGIPRATRRLTTESVSGLTTMGR
jgi:hypothetical protein